MRIEGIQGWLMLLVVIANFLLITSCSVSEPYIIIEKVRVNESALQANIVVSLSHAAKQQATVHYETVEISADQPQDFVAQSGDIVFLPGETTKNITVSIVKDSVVEGEEEFAIKFSQPLNITFRTKQGVIENLMMVSVIDDTPLPEINFNTTELVIDEADKIINVAATLSVPSSVPVIVVVKFRGSALPDEDFSFVSNGRLVFSPGEQTASISVAIRDDTEAECDEFLDLQMHTASNVTLGESAMLRMQITDNDVTGKDIEVGHRMSLKRPSEAAQRANDGDRVVIMAGDYSGDVAVWKQQHLLICGAPEGVVLHANGQSAQGKAIWVIQGKHVEIQNITFKDAKVKDKNGAGIRAEGELLKVSNCTFENNESGILSSNTEKATIRVAFSRFIDNGISNGRVHNIYIGRIAHFDLLYSVLHGAVIGHNVKTRAHVNQLFYNRIFDGRTGRASYQVDVSGGGDAMLIGNVIQQSAEAENSTIIAFGMEGLSADKNRLYLANNTIVNGRHSGIFIRAKSGIALVGENNLFVGNGEFTATWTAQKANITVTDKAEFVDYDNLHFGLQATSQAIDAGASAVAAEVGDAAAQYEITEDAFLIKRFVKNQIDVGAHEYF